MSALRNEPKAGSGMLEQLPNLGQVTADSLQAALIGMLRSLKSEEHHKQMEQLNRQGLQGSWAQLPLAGYGELFVQAPRQLPPTRQTNTAQFRTYRPG